MDDRIETKVGVEQEIGQIWYELTMMLGPGGEGERGREKGSVRGGGHPKGKKLGTAREFKTTKIETVRQGS